MIYIYITCTEAKTKSLTHYSVLRFKINVSLCTFHVLLGLRAKTKSTFLYATFMSSWDLGQKQNHELKIDMKRKHYIPLYLTCILCSCRPSQGPGWPSVYLVTLTLAYTVTLSQLLYPLKHIFWMEAENEKLCLYDA